MVEAVILGLVQGVVEWLPVSSEGVLVLLHHSLFQTPLPDAIRLALFLHLGTVVASIVYFWDEVKRIVRSVFSYNHSSKRDQLEVRLYAVITAVSVLIAAVMVLVLEMLATDGLLVGRTITVLVGVLLLATAYLQFKRKKAQGSKRLHDMTIKDSVIVGIGQGLAALPGVSRSGTTTALLLLRGISEEEALRISFIVSIPIVIIGNIALQLEGFTVSFELLVSFVIAFGVGLATIHALMKVARRISFAWFVLVFGVLVIASAFLVQ